MENILSIITFIPLIGAAILALFLRGEDEAAQNNAKWLAMIATSVTLFVAILLVAQFDPADTEFQFVEERDWIFGLSYKVGVDGISVLFVLLTTFLMPLTVLACWSARDRVKEYMIALMVLETTLVGAFVALDLVLFYLFFEGGLIPLFLIIGIWGGVERVYASFKFFLYTFIGSAVMLVAVMAIYVDADTTDITQLLDHTFSTAPIAIGGLELVGGLQTLLWLAFFASFAVKLPMWPLHTWLPDAHGQAPTAGSVVLAALVMKLGGYGFLRFSLPMFPVASELMAGFVLWLAAIAIIYAALVALAQTDIKRVIAYSTIAHMGFVTAGIFTANQQGVDGALFMMLSHGLIAGALFLCAGVLYDRMQTHEIDAYGGLIARMPAYGVLFMLFTLANIGLPGTAGFVGLFLTMIGIFAENTLIAVLAALGLVLTAAYGLWLYRRVMLGDLIKESLRSIRDLSGRERGVLAPLAIAILVLGVYPALVTDIIGPSVEALLADRDLALAEWQALQQVALSQAE
ncbi:MAG: NADH-quinone oxidoreductase subunit M [Pseudomonadota bacterium]